MREIIEQLKANRAKLDAAIAALTEVDAVEETKPRRGRPRRKPVQSATEIHIAGTPANKIRKDWATVHAAGLKSRYRPSQALVARAERILQKKSA